ncbi:MAG TPA: MiaB/RimO family radical SAM methylthiotransferase [Treponemataceae bacterium]|nr:MiaB/RimO family radical SAM methylthiotransferase [Treponemataceae bacterium]
MKTFFLDEHGCSKNQVDAEILVSRLENLGLKRVQKANIADLLLINTCGFIKSAKQESLTALMNARKAYPSAKILFAGCLAERYASEFAENLPEADAIFGNGDLSKIDEVIMALNKGERLILTPPQRGVCDGERNTLLNFPGSAYIKITEGCNNYCSFCAIPRIRGELRSRPIAAIVTEIQELVQRGIFEFNLIGQDLAAYGRDGVAPGATGDVTYAQEPSPLKRLLEHISALSGDFWLRLLYIHPDHFPRDIVPVINADKRFLHYFDIPFQSGDNTIITLMNRVGTAAKYEKLVQSLRKNLRLDNGMPGAVIRTTFLCGFPNESDEAAKRTEEFLQKIQPDWSGCFTYSLEENTTSYTMQNVVPKETAKKRAGRLQRLQSKITETRLKMHIGQTYRVLIEEIIEPVICSTQQQCASTNATEGLAIGRVWFQAPDVDGASVIRYDSKNKKEVAAIIPGTTVMVNVIGVSGVDLDTVLLV